jgi:hypothetical protein
MIKGRQGRDKKIKVGTKVVPDAEIVDDKNEDNVSRHMAE